MTIKASGASLSFTEIAAEFGPATDNRMGNYRVTYDNTPSGGSFDNLPLDAGIPQSGPIKFSHFYSKQLNIVVKGYGGGAESWASKDAIGVYDDNDVDVVGNFTSKPARNATDWQGGKTVKINVNKTIGSSMPATNEEYRCALKTGSAWPAATALSVDVGGQGIITGQGGHGGGGGSAGNNGGGGENGSSALGIQYSPINVNVAAGGIIQNGYGGGGGGGGSVRDPGKSDNDEFYSGGGGGAGAGYPHSTGGGTVGNEYPGTPGGNSTTQSAGGGGPGGNNGGEGPYGNGGRGGDNVAAQLGGSSGSREGPVGSEGEGGPAGSNGDAIRATMAQAGNVFISNSGSIRGDQEYSVAAGTVL